jgi:hypothetical protein
VLVGLAGVAVIRGHAWGLAIIKAPATPRALVVCGRWFLVYVDHGLTRVRRCLSDISDVVGEPGPTQVRDITKSRRGLHEGPVRNVEGAR